MPGRPPLPLLLLSAFFALGALIASATGIALLVPGSGLDPLWRLNPQAQVAFLAMGLWAIVLMFAVALACAVSALGLWIRAWGHRLALVLLGVNLVGDATSALVRNDLRTLIGVPIAGALISYLLSTRAQLLFTRRKPR